ncbi:MAG TPA: alpha/beta hydrolase, partial [Chthonomonadaceae bacterium]|nr:alpha/beta hydrolase [Chthonomonadaceae bacterium]
MNFFHRATGRAAALLFCLMAFCLMPLTASARAGQPQVEKDVVYGTAGGTKLLLDVYRPQSVTGKRPGVVLVHGGGWVAGDKSFYAPVGNLLAARGYVAFAIDYRLAPIFHYPAQVDDVQRAVRWVRAHAATYNLDPDRLGAIGDSAGG